MFAFHSEKGMAVIPTATLKQLQGVIMRRTTTAAIATLLAGGLSVGMAGPSLADTSDVNLRPDDMRGLQVVDEDGSDTDPQLRDRQGRDFTWTDNTRPSLTNDQTRSVLTGPDQTGVTRDWTRGADFTRDLTNTNTPTNTRTNTVTNTRWR